MSAHFLKHCKHYHPKPGLIYECPTKLRMDERESMKAEDIARVTHEANRAYCKTLGDNSQTSWAGAPAWQRESAIEGVKAIMEGRVATPEQSHESWFELKRSEGWKYGQIKNAETKEHPCFVPYAELPPEQKRKDHIFRAIVLACLGEP